MVQYIYLYTVLYSISIYFRSYSFNKKSEPKGLHARIHMTCNLIHTFRPIGDIFLHNSEPQTILYCSQCEFPYFSAISILWIFDEKLRQSKSSSHCQYKICLSLIKNFVGENDVVNFKVVTYLLLMKCYKFAKKSKC